MMHLLRLLQNGNELDIVALADKFEVTVQNSRKNLLLLHKNGWIISSGTTSNRKYRLSKQAIEKLGI